MKRTPRDIRKANNRIFILLLITIVAIGFAVWSGYSKQEAIDTAVNEQIELKNEIIEDCDILTKQNVELEKQIKLLEEKVKAQQAAIDRLMKLESVQEIKAVGMSEAMGEPLKGQVAVIQVMLDRATEWNMSVEEVVEAEGQFASPYKGEISESIDTAFELVFLDGYRAFEEPVTHFCTIETNPSWEDSKINRGTIQRHKFFSSVYS